MSKKKENVEINTHANICKYLDIHFLVFAVDKPCDLKHPITIDLGKDPCICEQLYIVENKPQGVKEYSTFPSKIFLCVCVGVCMCPFYWDVYYHHFSVFKTQCYLINSNCFFSFQSFVCSVNQFVLFSWCLSPTLKLYCHFHLLTFSTFHFTLMNFPCFKVA